MLAPLLGLLIAGQNAAWPPRVSDLGAEALARPENMPGDPDYAPREGGPRGCAGQLELYGYTPACTPEIAAIERDLGSGVAADRAWLLTRGQARVTIAIVDTGADWGDRELAGRWRLNAGELPGARDTNGDGVLTPLDFTSATGTSAPTIDRVIDDRLRARPDGGDTNGNGLLDPQDLQVIFGDGVDDDQDGLIDDICGWDFVDGDADATDPDADSHGARLARIAAGEANNGLGGAGVCPSCTVIPIRAVAPDGARGELYAEALALGSRQGARAILVGTTPDYATTALQNAVRISGALVIAPAGGRGGLSRETSFAGTPALVVSALDHDAFDRQKSLSALAPAATAGLAIERGVSAPGASDEDAAAIAAGVAGLAIAAAEGAAGGAPLAPALLPGELARLLEITATMPPASEQSSWALAVGSGRVNARRVVEAVIAREIPPIVELISPSPGTTLDPTPDLPFDVLGRVNGARGKKVRWVIDVAVGGTPSADAFSPIAVGEAEPGDAMVGGRSPIVGLFRDPTAPPGPPLAFAITVRLTASVPLGASTTRAEVRRVVWAHRDLSAIPGFPRNSDGPMAAAPRVADLEGDGQDEIIAATTDGSLLVFGVDGVVRPGWPVLAPDRPELLGVRARSPFAATPAVAPLGKTEAPSIIAVTEDGDLFALDAGGRSRPGFPVALGRASLGQGGRFSGPAVAQIGDGIAIVLTTSDGALFVVSDAGAILVRARGEGPLSAPAIAQRAGIAVVRKNALETYSATGELKRSVELEDALPDQPGRRPTPPGPVLGRGDRIHAVQIGGGAFTVAGDGLPQRYRGLDPAVIGDRSGAPRDLARLVIGPGEIAIADVAADGGLDLVSSVRSDSGAPFIGAWRDERTPAAFPLEARLATAVAFAIVDLDADARPEVVFADDHQRLRAVSAGGLSPRGWPKLLPAPIAGGPVIGDILADGHWTVVAATTEGRVHAWRSDGWTTSGAAWQGPRHDLAATADVEAATPSRTAEGAPSSCATSGLSPLLLLFFLRRLR